MVDYENSLFKKHQAEYFALRTQAPVKGIELSAEVLEHITFHIRNTLAECTPTIKKQDAMVLAALLIGRLTRAYPPENRKLMIDYAHAVISNEGED
jgi:hypothetical protein